MRGSAVKREFYTLFSCRLRKRSRVNVTGGAAVDSGLRFHACMKLRAIIIFRQTVCNLQVIKKLMKSMIAACLSVKAYLMVARMEGIMLPRWHQF